jgi:hypothetical protein
MVRHDPDARNKALQAKSLPIRETTPRGKGIGLFLVQIFEAQLE